MFHHQEWSTHWLIVKTNDLFMLFKICKFSCDWPSELQSEKSWTGPRWLPLPHWRHWPELEGRTIDYNWHVGDMDKYQGQRHTVGQVNTNTHTDERHTFLFLQAQRGQAQTSHWMLHIFAHPGCLCPLNRASEWDTANSWQQQQKSNYLL